MLVCSDFLHNQMTKPKAPTGSDVSNFVLLENTQFAFVEVAFSASRLSISTHSKSHAPDRCTSNA